MPKVAIIEDEVSAQDYLSDLLKKLDPTVEVVAKIDSIREAVPFYQSNPDVDISFMDIQIADGLSFEIFEHVSVESPIIFTTAYDQYAIDAFQVNSIDYLLKPIMIEDLSRAITKYVDLYVAKISMRQPSIETMVASFDKKKKKRCLVKKGGHFEYISVDDISHVNSEDSITFLFSRDGQRSVYAKPISQLIEELDEEIFFQINRSQIVNIRDVKEAHPYLNQRLKVILQNHTDTSPDMIVSRQKMQEFKAWMDQ